MDSPTIPVEVYNQVNPKCQEKIQGDGSEFQFLNKPSDDDKIQNTSGEQMGKYGDSILAKRKFDFLEIADDGTISVNEKNTSSLL